MPSRADRGAVIEDGTERHDMIAGVAVTQGSRSGGVGRQHAADRALGAAGGVGSEPPSFARQPLAQVAVDDAGLHAHRVRRDVENGPEVTAEIDDETRAEPLRPATPTRPAPRLRSAGYGSFSA